MQNITSNLIDQIEDPSTALVTKRRQGKSGLPRKGSSNWSKWRRRIEKERTVELAQTLDQAHEDLTDLDRFKISPSIFEADSTAPLSQTDNAKSGFGLLETPSSSTSHHTRSLSESLHIQDLPDEVFIDKTLTVRFNEDVAQLQWQVRHLHGRIRSSFGNALPLPWSVWDSESPKVLRTWLRVLISRWYTYNARKIEGGPQKDKKSSKSAKRAKTAKPATSDTKENDKINPGAMLNRDELEAGGMAFLLDEPETNKGELLSRLDRNQWRRMTRRKKQGYRFMDPLTTRGYSTSSHPVFDRSIGHTEKPSPNLPSTQNPPLPTTLPHLTSTGTAHMVSVSAKPHTTRTATAVGAVCFTNPIPLSLIRSNSLKKGDVLSVSRIAGIMAAKKCPDLIPLCHPIALTHVGVEVRAFGADDAALASTSETVGEHGGVIVEATVQCTGPTGVEMEALTAVMGATLSVVDMCKAVDKFQRVERVRVVRKEGGKSGTWNEEGWRSCM
jgi:molybdenum cofactor biosynthesis protein MoaC